jgi:hypothetical protein
MRISMVWFAVVAAAGACSAGPTESKRWHDKPSAPVQVTLEARPLGGDVYEVTLHATPKVDVPQLELRIDGEAIAVGATQARETRTMTRRVHLDGAAGRELAGGATVPVGGHRRSRAAVITLGAVSKPAAAPTKIITLGDGTEVEEVRQ